MNEQKIYVEASYVGSDQQRLVRAFEANVDFERVDVNHTEYAVKAFVPLQLIIDGTFIYLFEKLVLSPLLDPMVAKLDWKSVAEKYFTPIQPFKLGIKLSGDNLTIETSSITDINITANIWTSVKRTLQIVEDEHLIGKIDQIRFAQGNDNKLLIGCYNNNHLVCLIDLDKSTITPISNTAESLSSGLDLSDEDVFLQAIIYQAEQYKKFVDQQNKSK